MKRIKQNINKSIPLLIEKAGMVLNPMLLRLVGEKDQLLIFYFHGIYASEAEKAVHHVDPQNNLTLEQFDQFVQYFLKNGYQFIDQRNLTEAFQPGRSYIMMTFDDGYYNNSLTLKVLEKYKVPATFFITARNVLENKSYWWDIVYKYRMKQGWSLQAIRQEQQELKKLQYREIDAFTLREFGPESNTPWSDIDRPFTPDELKDFAASPYVSIGNHTFHHTILPNYDEEEMRRQMADTNEVLTKIIGYRPPGIAFPNGNFDERVLRVARSVGFRFAFTVQPKKNSLDVLPAGREMICLDRFMPEPRSVVEYGSFCRLGYDPNELYKSLKGRVGKLKKSGSSVR